MVQVLLSPRAGASRAYCSAITACACGDRDGANGGRPSSALSCALRAEALPRDASMSATAASRQPWWGLGSCGRVLETRMRVRPA